MNKKITWTTIYNDFKRRHPNLRKDVTYWCPLDYLTIELYFKDGSKGKYTYFEHKMVWSTDRWMKGEQDV